MGGPVRRWRAAPAALMLALAAVLVGSCQNPLNWTLQAWGYVDMVKVQGGTLALGDVEAYGAYADENPAHDVTLDTFLISRYEVTQHLYYAVMGTNPSWFQYSNGYTDEPCRPVDNVCWQDAVTFCNKLSQSAGLDPVYTFESDGLTVTWNTNANGYRLPTEAEWEYAARGGQTSQGFYLAGSDYEDDVAWYIGNSTYDVYYDVYITNPVGSKSANELGLYDMSGNVVEWVWDAYSSTYYSDNAQWTNPRGPADVWAPINQGYSFVYRGGSVVAAWEFLRSAMRFAINDNMTYSDLGFRVARNK